jgi:hypothetical protein
MCYVVPVVALSTSSLTASTPSSASSSRFSCHRRHPSLARSGAGPCPAGPTLPATPVIAFAGSVAVAAFPVGSPLVRPSWLDPPSLWPDRVFPAGSVAAVAFPIGSVIPLLFCRGRGRYDCGGISTRRLLPSASTPVSSCVVPPLRLRGMLDCVCEWAGTTVGLPAH